MYISSAVSFNSRRGQRSFKRWRRLGPRHANLERSKKRRYTRGLNRETNRYFLSPNKLYRMFNTAFWTQPACSSAFPTVVGKPSTLACHIWGGTHREAISQETSPRSHGWTIQAFCSSCLIEDTDFNNWNKKRQKEKLCQIDVWEALYPSCLPSTRRELCVFLRFRSLLAFPSLLNSSSTNAKEADMKE